MDTNKVKNLCNQLNNYPFSQKTVYYLMLSIEHVNNFTLSFSFITLLCGGCLDIIFPLSWML